MDFLQEDVDQMQRELENWKKVGRCCCPCCPLLMSLMPH